MKITVETVVDAPIARVWDAWSNPTDIMQWNAASDDWHTTSSRVDLRDGGSFLSRMEAKDGSAGFDFEGTYTRVQPRERIEYRLGDDREVVVEFQEQADGVLVRNTFDAESTFSPDVQRDGWQAILDRFGRHVEGRRTESAG